MNLTRILDLLLGNSPVNREWLAAMEHAWGDAFSSEDVATIEAALQQTPSPILRKEASSRLASFLLDCDRNIPEALRLFTQNAAGSGIPWFYKLRHAECLAASGRPDEAIAMVESVYRAYPEAVNGYAAIGWHFGNRNTSVPTPFEYASRDINANRLSPGYMLNVAVLAAQENRCEEARTLIQQAYDADPSLTDGHARCGWRRYQSDRDMEALMGQLEADHLLNRLSPPWLLRLAQYLTQWGRINEMQALLPALTPAMWTTAAELQRHVSLLIKVGNYVEVAERSRALYRLDSAARDGLAAAARIACPCGHISFALKLFHEEHELGRLTAAAAIEWASLLMWTGQRDLANKVGREACTSDPSLARKWHALAKANAKAPLPDIERHIARLFDDFDDADKSGRAFMMYSRSPTCVARILDDYRLVKQISSPADTVVDVGCVPPLLLSLLNDFGYGKLTAIDPAAVAFRTFFDRHHITWHSLGLEQLYPPDLNESADLVLCCEVLEHLAGNILPLLENVCSLVKPGGRLLLTTPNLRSVSGLYALLAKHSGLASKPSETVRQQYERANSNMRYFGHLREYTRREVIVLMESFGMKLEKAAFAPPYRCDTLSAKCVWLVERLLPAWRLNQQLIFRKLT